MTNGGIKSIANALNKLTKINKLALDFWYYC